MTMNSHSSQDKELLYIYIYIYIYSFTEGVDMSGIVSPTHQWVGPSHESYGRYLRVFQDQRETSYLAGRVLIQYSMQFG